MAVLALAWLALGGCATPARTGPDSAGSTGAGPAGDRSSAQAARAGRPETAVLPGSSDPPPTIAFPQVGAGAWTLAGGSSGVAGGGGTLLRFQVAVERDITGVDPDAFGEVVHATLADPRSWTAGGRWRLQRVGPDQPHNFTVYLATPATRDRLCGSGYDRYTSCRSGDSVVLNVARWAFGVPHFDADLGTYRQYMINHEVGHRLGQGHELCPGPGRPAPVMQQQTLGLHGCLGNPWVYLDNVRYAGRSGQYDDPIPR